MVSIASLGQELPDRTNGRGGDRVSLRDIAKRIGVSRQTISPRQPPGCAHLAGGELR